MLILLAFILLCFLDLNKYVHVTKDVNQTVVFEKLINIIKKDKITKTYLLYIMVGQIAYTTGLGMTMTFLTVGIGLDSRVASIIFLVTGLAGVGFGILALAKLTPKNDYITLSIKYFLRMLGFVCALVFNSKVAFIIAFLYPRTCPDTLLIDLV